MTDLVSSKVSVESIYSEVKNRKIKGNIYATFLITLLGIERFDIRPLGKMFFR
jgi:hypothetical protein